MFAELGEQLDDWLHVQNLRRIRLFRRLGLIPPPTPEQRAAAESWMQALASIERMNRLAPLMRMRLDLLERLNERNAGTTVNFHKYGALRTATEALKDGPEHVQPA